MSKYLDYDGLSHFKDKLDDNLKTNINPVISTTIDSEVVLTDEAASIANLVTAELSNGGWITTQGTDDEDSDTFGGKTYYIGRTTWTATATLSEVQEADTTVIVKVSVRSVIGIDEDDESNLTNVYSTVTYNLTITIPAGETSGSDSISIGSYVGAGTGTVSVVSATTSTYTEQQTMTVTHLDGDTDTYIFNGNGTILSGSTVVANDGGSYSEDLETLTIDGTGYNIPSGGSSGGSLYLHCLNLYQTGVSTAVLRFFILDTLSDDYTSLTSVAAYLYRNGITSASRAIMATGHFGDYAGYPVTGVYAYNSSTLYVSIGSGDDYNYFDLSLYTLSLTDCTIQIM